MMTLTELASAVNGTLEGKDALFTGVSINGRAINDGDLYVAIKGDRFDGHDFIDQARQAGAVACLVERKNSTSLASVNVDQTRVALGFLAKYWRQRFDFPVVAITGSNGKTTVKEITTAILSQQYKTLATAGNLNNELGVPLTLLKLTHQHQAAVIEMGANHHGEIAYLASLTQPTIGLVTNAGSAHLEGFGDLQGVANAKGELFSSLADDAIAIINADDEYYPRWREMAGQKKTLSFGLAEQADVRATNINIADEGQGVCSTFQLEYQSRSELVKLPLTGLHNVMNGLAGAAVGIAAGLSLDVIADGLAAVNTVSGRLETLPGYNQSVVINDSYNANPSSFEVALQSIEPMSNERWCVLGDFGELGEQSDAVHEHLAIQAKEYGISRLFALGDKTRLTVSKFGDGAVFYASHDELTTELKQQLHKGVVVLIKGSRAQKLETIVGAIVDESVC